jgi:hypothetical protein
MSQYLLHGRAGCLALPFGVAAALVAAKPANATDEIQVYNADIAAVGQFTIQQHLNDIPLGLKEPPFPSRRPTGG